MYRCPHNAPLFTRYGPALCLKCNMNNPTLPLPTIRMMKPLCSTIPIGPTGPTETKSSPASTTTGPTGPSS